jgi:hypothetical protein
MMLMIPKGYETAARDAKPDPKAMAEMEKYNDSLRKAGILLAADGLQPPVSGARVSFKAGQATVRQGPFSEVNETLGGFWIIEAKSQQDAIEWASRCPASDTEVIEVRQIAGD